MFRQKFGSSSIVLVLLLILLMSSCGSSAPAVKAQTLPGKASGVTLPTTSAPGAGGAVNTAGQVTLGNLQELVVDAGSNSYQMVYTVQVGATSGSITNSVTYPSTGGSSQTATIGGTQITMDTACYDSACSVFATVIMAGPGNLGSAGTTQDAILYTASPDGSISLDLVQNNTSFYYATQALPVLLAQYEGQQAQN